MIRLGLPPDRHPPEHLRSTAWVCQPLRHAVPACGYRGQPSHSLPATAQPQAHVHSPYVSASQPHSPAPTLSASPYPASLSAWLTACPCAQPLHACLSHAISACVWLPTLAPASPLQPCHRQTQQRADSSLSALALSVVLTRVCRPQSQPRIEDMTKGLQPRNCVPSSQPRTHQVRPAREPTRETRYACQLLCQPQRAR